MFSPDTTRTPTIGHTPGPWHVHEGHVYADQFVRDVTVVMDGIEQPHRMGLIALPYTPAEAVETADELTAMYAANARLIAAAPDLLDALQGLARLGELHCMNDVLNPCWDNRPTDIAGKHWGGGVACPACHARAAIAKAEGGANV